MKLIEKMEHIADQTLIRWNIAQMKHSADGSITDHSADGSITDHIKHKFEQKRNGQYNVMKRRAEIKEQRKLDNSVDNSAVLYINCCFSSNLAIFIVKHGLLL